MVKLLVANGCSCTRGEELADAQAQCWPTLLGQDLAIPVVNIARDGASNRRIVRSTVALLPTIIDECRVAPKDVQVIIAWTETSRHEYRSTLEAPERNRAHPDLDVDASWQRIGPWRRKVHRPTRAFYKYLWDDHGQLDNFVTDWIMLDAYLSVLGVQARYCFARWIPEVPSSISALQGRLDGQRVWGGLYPDIGHTLEGVPDRMPKGPGGHPLAEGHRWFADQLRDWLKETRR